MEKTKENQGFGGLRGVLKTVNDRKIRKENLL